MAKVCEIRDYFEKMVPSSMKMEFDNVGFLAGFSQKEVTCALVALDITTEVVDEAVSTGAELIVSHHPILFQAKSVTDTDVSGRRITALLKAGISAICLHTNLDAAPGGVNDALIKALGAVSEGALADGGVDDNGRVYGTGRVGELVETVPFVEFLASAKKALRSNGLRYYDTGLPVRRLAVVGGSGGDYIAAAKRAGCDTFVTADVKYNHFIEAKELGINLIDGDHFCTENVVVPVIAEMLREGFSEIKVMISEKHAQTARFYV